MASQVGICNTALGRIGARQRIGALTEQSEEARILRLVYDQVLELTLEQVNWGFARRRATLALVETDPNEEWKYRYALPSDCACPRNIQGYTRNPSIETLIRWQVEGADDPALKTIVTDQPDAILIYTRNDVPPGAYPQHFTHLLEWSLAAEIAMPLTAKAEVAQLAVSASNAARMMCGAMSANRGQPDNELDSEFVRARE